jgi:putative hydrolase of the HAD superfamily
MQPDFSAIRHIIFDLGGVLLNIDYSATEKAFRQLGISDFQERYSQLSQNSFFDDWETGRLSREDFFKGLQHAGCEALSDAQIEQAWNAMLLDFPLRRLQLLQQLRLRYDLFLLSNTNEIHEEAFNKLLNQTCGWSSLGHFFDKIYFSHRVGLRKPGRDIFKRILQENGLKAEHTLFIDDSPQHIETAKSLGIRTIFLEPGMSIENDVFLPRKP